VLPNHQPDYLPQKERGGRMKKTALLILGIIIVAQILVPASLILKHERILRNGELYRFKTRPIDPADPFQGRYIRLGFENDYIPEINENAPTPEWKEKVFVTLGSETNGLCILKSWSRTKPKKVPYLKLRYMGTRSHWDRESRKSSHLGLRFELPFNRFYMEENKAPRAEKIVQGNTFNLNDPESTNRGTNCWANVRVLNGTALIEDVLINGTSIQEFVIRQN
jgi:uncharacterized membrane-anchored protein